MANKVFNNSCKSQRQQLLLFVFDVQPKFVVYLVNEITLLFVCFILEYLLCLHFSPSELKETLRPPTNDFGKVKRVFMPARGVRACLQLLCCTVS